MTPFATLLRRGIVASLVAGTLFGSQTAHAAETEEARNRALVAQGLQAWADGTGSPYDLLAPDARWTIAGNSLAGKTYPSKEAFLAEVIRPFNARMRDRLIPTVHRLYADGDTVVAHFDAKGVALDGKAYANSYAWILRLQGGQIVEAHAFFDAIAFDDFWKRVTPATRP
ncbi:nuclear transport factor 2 family protein [Sphingoaurantiacus capsulatus]|uniref:Nuclear transport factor 2 family protein n=1 Tax=Sphingoaurantiacus capsulatus TaxID=1771310 RepID=A0ABV7X748_9SPHN